MTYYLKNMQLKRVKWIHFIEAWRGFPNLRLYCTEILLTGIVALGFRFSVLMCLFAKRDFVAVELNFVPVRLG